MSVSARDRRKVGFTPNATDRINARRHTRHRFIWNRRSPPCSNSETSTTARSRTSRRWTKIALTRRAPMCGAHNKCVAKARLPPTRCQIDQAAVLAGDLILERTLFRSPQTGECYRQSAEGPGEIRTHSYTLRARYDHPAQPACPNHWQSVRYPSHCTFNSEDYAGLLSFGPRRTPNVGRCDSGGNTHHDPSPCWKKRIARGPDARSASARTHRRGPGIA
ncbi:hypothetical protein B0G75_14014 [Paraburkholderia sp. BL18I3N2]|nr:hypothetical protein B0G75_14014 [Paraburkholderia sp. BL18I3N2]PRX87885.1 hypothetical protein B0G73_15112 [Paraburkholderia sp. BL25I1N1]